MPQVRRRAQRAANAAALAEAAQLHALIDAQCARDLRDTPPAATCLGDLRYDGRSPDLTRANLERIAAADRRVLEDLAAIPRARLPPAAQLNCDLFRNEYENRIAAYEAWLRRRETPPIHLDQATALLPEGIAAGRAQARVPMQRVVPQPQMHVVASPEERPFVAQFGRLPDSIRAADRERLADRCERRPDGREGPLNGTRRCRTIVVR